MSDLRKAAEMALEVFEHLSKGESPAITKGELVYEIAALRQALAMENFSEVNQEIEEALRQALEEPANSTTDFVESKAPSETEQECTCSAKDMPFGKCCKAQPEQEAFTLDRGCWERGCVAYDERDGDGVMVLNREWVGLTDEEMRTLKQKSVDDGMTRIVSDFEYIRSIEAKLKEKNGGTS